jgi:hypothetical protein
LLSAYDRVPGQPDERAVASADILRDHGRMSEIGVHAVPANHVPRRYYGWYIVAVCNVVAMMTWGIGVFNQGVFIGHFVDRYGWPRAALSFGPLLFYAWAGLVGLTVSALGSYGPILAVVAGTLLLSSVGMRWAVPPQ